MLITALSGCSSGSTPPPTAFQGLKVYHHSLESTPSSLDPVQAANVYANHVAVNAYDTLYSFRYLARPYALKPNLATDFPEISADGLVYTMHIKPGVHFVDDAAFPGGKGREVVAEDFIYSIKREFDPANRPQGAWFWQGRIVGLDEWKEAGSDYAKEIPGLRALDPHTVQIHLKRPYPQLPFTLAQGYAAVVPREAVEYYGKEFAVHPVGSGPFKVISYDTSRIVFVRNAAFRQEPVDLAAEGYDPSTQKVYGVEAIAGRSPPFVDRLVIDFIGDDASRWNSFTKGNEVQLTVVPPEKVDEILASRDPLTLKPELAEKYFLIGGVEAGFILESFNFNYPDFGYNPDPARESRNRALRCAIIKAFDWQGRNDSWFFGLGKVFPGIIVPAVPEFDPGLSQESITRDVEGAKRLLKENGWNADNLPVLVYGIPALVDYRMRYEQFRAWLVEIGYPPQKVQVKRYSTFGELSTAWRESRLPLVSKGWALDYPDAENTLQLFYGPNGSPGSNDANYRNPAYDALYEQSRVMQPSPERTALYQKMNQMLIDDCVSITGLARTRIYLWHKNVIQVPDHDIVAGFYLKYVDVLPEGQVAGGAGSH